MISAQNNLIQDKIDWTMAMAKKVICLHFSGRLLIPKYVVAKARRDLKLHSSAQNFMLGRVYSAWRELLEEDVKPERKNDRFIWPKREETH
jgi:hypothetical protein